MGVDTAPAISAALVEHGRDPQTPVAVVSDGASPAQRTFRTTLAGLAQTIADEQVRPPAVWVVGEVVALSAGGPEVVPAPAGSDADAPV
jgi:uroporphyrin-III C-methyltransferase/precorrin-2 dehydrogenase/sirohydrochlorin ferrochelatase